MLHAVWLILTGSARGKNRKRGRNGKSPSATAAVLRRRSWPLLLHAVIFWLIFVGLFIGVPSQLLFGEEMDPLPSTDSSGGEDVAVDSEGADHSSSFSAVPKTGGFHHCTLLWQAFSLYFLYLSLSCVSGLMRLIHSELVAIVDSRHHQPNADAVPTSVTIGRATSQGHTPIPQQRVLVSGCTTSYSYGLGRLEVLTVFTSTVVVANLIMYLVKESLEAIVLSGGASRESEYSVDGAVESVGLPGEDHHGIGGAHVREVVVGLQGASSSGSDGVGAEHVHSAVGSMIWGWVPRGIVMVFALLCVYAYGAFYVGTRTNAMRGDRSAVVGRGHHHPGQQASRGLGVGGLPGIDIRPVGILSRSRRAVEMVLLGMLRLLASFGILARDGGLESSGAAFAACADHIASASLSAFLLLVNDDVLF